jgi:hypothetical protein
MFLPHKEEDASRDDSTQYRHKIYLTYKMFFTQYRNKEEDASRDDSTHSQAKVCGCGCGSIYCFIIIFCYHQCILLSSQGVWVLVWEWEHVFYANVFNVLKNCC